MDSFFADDMTPGEKIMFEEYLPLLPEQVKRHLIEFLDSDSPNHPLTIPILRGRVEEDTWKNAPHFIIYIKRREYYAHPEQGILEDGKIIEEAIGYVAVLARVSASTVKGVCFYPKNEWAREFFNSMIQYLKPTSPPIEDPTDQRIWDLIKKDPDIKDKEIVQKLGLTRQTVSTRRRALQKMGYPVR
jgi:hypothetical protein